MSRAPSPAVGVATDTGRVRDHNEDGYLVRPPLYAVADGMGGHAAGEVASRLALDSLRTSPLGAEVGREAVRRALTEANRVVFVSASEEGSSRGMGTTCALLLLTDGEAHLGHVGDSRIYRLRAGSLSQLTRDHTVVGEMVERGLITPAEAMADDSRGYLTRALGGSARVEVDVQTVDVRPGDRYLLCSDGLSTMLPDERIEQILVAAQDPQTAADTLVNAANDAGGEDNVTALVVDPVSLPAAVGRGRGRGRRMGAALLALAIAVAIVGVAILVLLMGGLPQLAPGATDTPGPVQSIPVATDPPAPVPPLTTDSP